jgi:hypothetical protein
MDNTATSSHRWRFCRLGGFDQVRLESASDISNLKDLDQKLWAALSCPVSGLEFDKRTLAMLDHDNDGRVRVQEILTATTWVSSVLQNLDGFLAGSDTLKLADINDQSESGQRLLASARQLLALLGKGEAQEVSIGDVASTDTLLNDSQFNGDGIIAANATDSEELAQLLADIVTAVGGEPDRSGQLGISREKVDAFFAAAEAYAKWWKTAEETATILPCGAETERAAALLSRLTSKIDDYFVRCGLAAYDQQATVTLNPSAARYELLAAHDLAPASVELEALPLARIEADRSLALTQGINPAWTETMAGFVAVVVKPLLGDTEALTAEQWQTLKTTFAPFHTWQASKAGSEVEGLGLARVRTILESDGKSRLLALIEQDLQLAPQINAIDEVARLVHFHHDLYRLLNNFVTFRDFYVQDRKAIFQAGTLYIDGRACELCIKVASPEAHSPLAGLSRTYLAYCQCQRRGSEEKMCIAAAFTGGDADNLMVGRNGVFYDCQGKDWDATIVKIIDHPISVSQAFLAPYKRVGRMIGEQLEKFAAAKDKAVDAKAGTTIAGVAAKPATPPAPAPAAPAAPPPAPPLPFDVGKFAGIFAAFGLALGALGTAVASIVGVFLALPLWQMPLAVAGLLLVVSGPSMLIAYLKLRQRNLGPILDANGWAVNTKARINIPFGSTLTKLAVLPKGAERTLTDPFAEKKTPWKRWAFLLALLIALAFAWNQGYLAEWGKKLQTPATTEKTAPASK